jgi:hypothetical protein
VRRGGPFIVASHRTFTNRPMVAMRFHRVSASFDW